MKVNLSVLVMAASVVASVALETPAFAGDTPSAPGSSVYIVNLEDGASVTSPVLVVFGLSGMGVAPAGVEKENTGHHHLLLNRPPLGEGEGEEGAEEFQYAMPGTDNLIHYGGGQTQTTLELEPGEHSLQLVLGDFSHVPHNLPLMSDRITITVK